MADEVPVCAEIRKLSKIPIVFLSSADDNMNIVKSAVEAADVDGSNLSGLYGT